MNNLDLESSMAVAGQVNTTCTAVDQSIAEMATLTKKIVSASRKSELAPAASQQILQTMALGISKLVDGRSTFVDAHKQMIDVKLKSNQKVTDFGCWGDGPLVNPLVAELKVAA